MNTNMPFEAVEEIINLQETPIANAWKDMVSIVEQEFQALNTTANSEPKLKKDSWVRFTIKKEVLPAIYLTAFLDFDSNSINVTITHVKHTPTKRLSSKETDVFHFQLGTGNKLWRTNEGKLLTSQEIANYILQPFLERPR